MVDFERHCSAEEDEFRKELVGKSIKEINDVTGTITLTDGTFLVIEDGGDCCEHYAGTLKEVNLTQNVITKVERNELDKDDEYGDGTHFEVVIYSVNEHIASVEVTGSEPSGYYGHSIDLKVYRPTK